MNNSSNNKSHNHTDGRVFKKSIHLISQTVLIGLISQNIYHWVGKNFLVPGIGFLAGILVFIGLVALMAKPLYRIIDNPPFNVSNLIFIALATALGTFIPQQTDAAVPGLIGFLQLNDIFHSWWYVSFFALMAGGLVKISSKKKFNLENIGFHLAHLSPILVLCGFWADHFLGFKGIIKLEEGQQKSTVLLYNGQSGEIYDSTELGFSIRLDHFEFENHEPDYRIQLWKRDTTGRAVMVSHGEVNDPKPSKMVASLPLEPGKIHRIYGSDMRFRLSEFYPDFEFEYEYPTNIDTITAKDPGIMIDLKTMDGDAFVQLRANVAGRNKLADMVNLGAWLEFYWDLPDSLNNRLSSAIQTGFTKQNRIIFDGKNQKIYFLIHGKITEKALKTNEFHAMSENGNIGFSVRHLMPDVAYMKATPATKSQELKNPVAKVEVWKKGGSAQNAFLYPTQSAGKGGSFIVPGTLYFLAMESIKDKETKYYKSEVSVVGEDGQIVKQSPIKVNEPMLYKGFRFYQNDYDPQNPNYSGIGVSQEPGLMVIYMGFFLLVAGVAHMFYVKKVNNHA